MCVVLKVYASKNKGDWSNGMIGVSKTFGGGSIPSSPAKKTAILGGFFHRQKSNTTMIKE